jgi:hypothetical protein
MAGLISSALLFRVAAVQGVWESEWTESDKKQRDWVIKTGESKERHDA